MGCEEGDLKLDLSKIDTTIVCGGSESIPADTSEGLIHPREATDAFALLAIHVGRFKIVIWIRGFLGVAQFGGKILLNFLLL